MSCRTSGHFKETGLCGNVNLGAVGKLPMDRCKINHVVR